MLFSLTLENTGITVPDLASVLWAASSVQHLAIIETVSKSLSLASQQMPPLASISLQTLHFEISSSEDVHGLQKPAESYYSYLASSLHQNALPALTTLYVRDQNFPEHLILPPFAAPFGNGANGHQQQGKGFNQTLEVFSKGIDELEWVFTSIVPQVTGDKRSSMISGGRPLSAYNAGRGLGPQWAQGGFGGEARKSVIVGNGFGGFLAVPQEEVPHPAASESPNGQRWGSAGSAGSGSTIASLLRPPPSMSEVTGAHKRRGSKHDLWR
jgi:hypothetical protein